MDLIPFLLLIPIAASQASFPSFFLPPSIFTSIPVWLLGHLSTVTFGNDTCMMDTFSKTGTGYGDSQFTKKPCDTRSLIQLLRQPSVKKEATLNPHSQ